MCRPLRSAEGELVVRLGEAEEPWWATAVETVPGAPLGKIREKNTPPRNTYRVFFLDTRGRVSRAPSYAGRSHGRFCEGA